MSDWKETETMRQAREQRVPRARYDEVCREMDALRAQLEQAHEALRVAINTVECSSICSRTGEELPWYKMAKCALSTSRGRGYINAEHLTPTIELLGRIWEIEEMGYTPDDPESQSRTETCNKCEAVMPHGQHAENCPQPLIQKELARLKALKEGK